MEELTNNDRNINTVDNKFNKKIFIYIIIGVCILLITSFLYFKLRIVNVSPGNSNPTSTLQKPHLTNIQIAKITLNWLNQQRDATGIYSLGCSCKDNRCINCKPLPSSWRETSFIIWGESKYYEKTKDQEVLKNINKDFDALEGKVLQINNWHCKLLYDVWHNSIDKAIKNKAFNLCKRAGYEGRKEDSISETDVNNIILTDMKKTMSKTTFEISKEFNQKDLKENFQRNASMVSENVIISMWDGLIEKDTTRESIKKAGIEMFKNALYGYELRKKEKPSIIDNSLLGIASLDLYKATNQQDYLNFALYLYQENKILEATSSSSYEYIYSALFTSEVINAVHYKKYEFDYSNVLTKIVNRGFDYPGYESHLTDIGAISDLHKNYITKENGLAIGLLSN